MKHLPAVSGSEPGSTHSIRDAEHLGGQKCWSVGRHLPPVGHVKASFSGAFTAFNI